MVQEDLNSLFARWILPENRKTEEIDLSPLFGLFATYPQTRALMDANPMAIAAFIAGLKTMGVAEERAEQVANDEIRRNFFATLAQMKIFTES